MSTEKGCPTWRRVAGIRKVAGGGGIASVGARIHDMVMMYLAYAHLYYVSQIFFLNKRCCGE
jgi:hypothetical protein